jgi:hypothetical protein
MDHYDDIIALPHHQSERRPRMPRQDRAAQFAPFAALNGYGAAITEAGRLTDAEVELMEGRAEAVDAALRTLCQRQHEQPEITVTFFRPDDRKAGGTYRTVTGRLRKFMEYQRLLRLWDDTAIPFDDIYELSVAR